MGYDRIDVCECIGIDKTDNLRECIICHYGWLVRINFRFQPKVCDGCHDMTRKSMSFMYVAIVTVKIIDYRIHFWGIFKSEAMHRMKNADLSKKADNSDYEKKLLW